MTRIAGTPFHDDGPPAAPPTNANVLKMRLFRTVSNTELNEGRGREITLAWSLTRDQASVIGKGNYVFGTDCPVEEKEVEVVRTKDGRTFLLGEEVVLKYEDPADVRKRAIAKLTIDEQKALGLAPSDGPERDDRAG